MTTSKLHFGGWTGSGDLDLDIARVAIFGASLSLEELDFEICVICLVCDLFSFDLVDRDVLDGIFVGSYDISSSSSSPSFNKLSLSSSCGLPTQFLRPLTVLGDKTASLFCIPTTAAAAIASIASIVSIGATGAGPGRGSLLSPSNVSVPVSVGSGPSKLNSSGMDRGGSITNSPSSECSGIIKKSSFYRLEGAQKIRRFIYSIKAVSILLTRLKIR